MPSTVFQANSVSYYQHTKLQELPNKFNNSEYDRECGKNVRGGILPPICKNDKKWSSEQWLKKIELGATTSTHGPCDIGRMVRSICCTCAKSKVLSVFVQKSFSMNFILLYLNLQISSKGFGTTRAYDVRNIRKRR